MITIMRNKRPLRFFRPCLEVDDMEITLGGGGHVIQKVYAVASQTMVTSRARGPKTRDPKPIPTKKEDPVSTNLVHLAPFWL
jgi:hypothetical protein